MRPSLAVLLAGIALAGCAGRSPTAPPPGAPAEAPPAPASERSEPAEVPAPSPDTTAARTSPTRVAPAPTPTPETPPPPLESVMAPDERRRTLSRIVADTTAAGSAVRRCTGRRLLPDQESVFDTALSLLGQARDALERDELWRAESLARKARQLASSLNCPG